MSKTNKTPIEDLRKRALNHYDEASLCVKFYNNIIPKAINLYFDNLQNKEQSTHKLIDVYCDNGDLSHHAVIEMVAGVKVWSEHPEECKAMGYPVEPQSNDKELIEFTQWLFLKGYNYSDDANAFSYVVDDHQELDYPQNEYGYYTFDEVLTQYKNSKE